jgi:ketosteroid isomerase-like protein
MRNRWEAVFSEFSGAVGFEIADLSITVGQDMAFSHSFNRASATLPTGQQIGTWVRWTACWRKVGGQWLLVHDQVSVPVDVQTGKAVLDSQRLLRSWKATGNTCWSPRMARETG